MPRTHRKTPSKPFQVSASRSSSHYWPCSIITRGLDKSGITRSIAQNIVRLGDKGESRLIALFSATTAFLSLFMNNLAAGALVLPIAMEVARKTGIKPSKLLIPVAYGSLLGGSALHFTTANIVMSDLLRIANPPQPPPNILDFTPTGGLIAIAGILFLGLAGKRLLPDHEPTVEQTLARFTGSELEDVYLLGEPQMRDVEAVWAYDRLKPAFRAALAQIPPPSTTLKGTDERRTPSSRREDRRKDKS